MAGYAPSKRPAGVMRVIAIIRGGMAWRTTARKGRIWKKLITMHAVGNSARGLAGDPVRKTQILAAATGPALDHVAIRSTQPVAAEPVKSHSAPFQPN